MFLKSNIYLLAVYLTKIVLLSLKINIYRSIGAPCIGKDVVYGINVRDKCI